MKNKQLNIILITALLEIISFGIILPILPFVVEGYGYGSEWVGISFAMSSVGMFIGGLIFGRLSDKYGRKKILSYTVLLNVIGYSMFFLSGNIYVFILSRTISGFAGAGLGVAQAYISDISKPEEVTKNMGLMGAMFGIGIILGPAFGSLFSGKSLFFLGGIAAFILFINALIVWFILPESQKCIECAKMNASKDSIEFKKNKKQLLALFLATFGTALGFSGNQSILSLFLNSRFSISEQKIGYVFAFIGTISVIYQVLLIKHTRRILKERGLVIFGLILLTISFLFFGFSDNIYLTFACIAMFPIAYGSINPGINSLIAKYAENETGKAMGTSVSYMSIANIFGPLIAGFAYKYHFSGPYVISCIFFIFTLFIVKMYIRE